MRVVTKIAITGGIAEGKSTVVGYLRELGCNVVSADEVAKRLWDDPRVQDKVSVLFKMPVPLDRETVRQRITDDVEARRSLNSVFHPRTTSGILESPAAVAEVPLLIEACLQGLFARVWVVTCGPELQLERLTARLGDPALARAMIATQLPSCVKCAFADHVIRTDQPVSSVKQLVESLARDHGLA